MWTKSLESICHGAAISTSCWNLMMKIFSVLIVAMVIHNAPPGALAQIQSPTTELEESNNKIRVCTANLPPMTYCSPDQPSSKYTGFDMTMFRDLADEIGWDEGVDFDFECVPFSKIINDITNETSEGDTKPCDIGVASITITVDRQEKGARFSFPYLNTGLAVVVKASVETSSGWAWMEPFTADLWIAVIFTSAAVPIFLFLIEFGSLKRRIYLKDVVPGVSEAGVRSVWTLLGGETLEVASFGAKFFALCWAFVALVVIENYTANLAAFLTVKQINSQISDVGDLRGLAVSTHEAYIERLRDRYGITASVLGFEELEDLERAVNSVVDGTLASVISDAPLVYHVLGMQETCIVRSLPHVIEKFNYGIAFRPGIDNTLVDLFSAAILRISEDGVLERLSDSYFAPGRNSCSSTVQSSQKITFKELWGLWVILAAGAFIGFLFTALARYERTQRRKRKLTRSGTLDTIPMPKFLKFPRLVKTESMKTDGSMVSNDVLSGDFAEGTPGETSQERELVKNPGPVRQDSAMRGAAEKLSHLQKRSSIFGEVWKQEDQDLSSFEIVEEDENGYGGGI